MLVTDPQLKSNDGGISSIKTVLIFIKKTFLENTSSKMSH